MPTSRAACTTQSTMRRPSSGCRCFGVALFMRVPRPPAITTAARSSAMGQVMKVAGAPGFEPGITGPKPVALPLGHAPSRGRMLPAVGEDEEKGDRSEDAGGEDGRPEQDEGENGSQDREQLRGREDPRGLPEGVRTGSPACEPVDE